MTRAALLGAILLLSGCLQNDPCALCDPNATCTNHVCTCDPGFAGDGGICIDDPCSLSNGGCDPNATCSVVEGLPTCACNTGYFGTGTVCEADFDGGPSMNQPGPDGGVCDGFAVRTDGGAQIDVETAVFGSTLLAEGCDNTLTGATDGTAIMTVGGIYELDLADNGATLPAAAVFPGNCGDMGLTGFTAPAATAITPPMGAVSVGAAYGTTPTGAIYGVVTAIDPWAAGLAGPSSNVSGTLFLQDATASATPSPHTGVQIYFASASAASYGVAPSVGDVVSITGLTWSPLEGVNEYAAGENTVVAVLGTSPLPPVVMLAPSALAPGTSPSMSSYEGMRVQATGGPFTVHGSALSNTCPAALETTSSE